MYKNILLPLDAGGVPPDVVAHTINLARDLGAAVVGLRVVTVMPSEEPFFQRVQVEVGSRGARLREEANALLGNLEGQFRDAGVAFSGEVLVSDATEPDAIVKHAEDKGCDLILMAMQEQSGVSRWLMGNTADKVRHRAGMPVLFVRSGGKSSGEE